MTRYDGTTPTAASLVTVYVAGTQMPATIYADDLSTPLGNPFTSDSLTGRYTFWAALAAYDIVVNATGTPLPVPVVNPNDLAFGIVAVGADQIAALVPHDALGLIAGTNITLTADVPGRTVQIDAAGGGGGGTPSPTVADLDGTGDAGVSTDYSRGDHRHADTNRPTDDQKAAFIGTAGIPSGANAYVTDSDARLTDDRVPTAHATSHENGGTDEVSVAGLSGTLADPQTPVAHHARHENAGDDEISVTGLSGLLGDPQTALAHHTSHENGGGDEINVTGLTGLLGDAQTPINHHTRHENGGVDEISVAGLSGVLADAQTVTVDAAGALSGDGAAGTPLAVVPDGVGIQITANQLALVGPVILTSVVNIANADIKKLPSVPIELVAAPAANKRIKILSVSIQHTFTVAAYTGISATYAALQVTTDNNAGPWVACALINDSTTTPPLTTVTDLFGATGDGFHDLLPGYQQVGGDWWEPQPTGGGSFAQSVQKNVTIAIDNNSSPTDLGGGNAGQSMRVVTYYTIEDVIA